MYWAYVKDSLCSEERIILNREVMHSVLQIIVMWMWQIAPWCLTIAYDIKLVTQVKKANFCWTCLCLQGINKTGEACLHVKNLWRILSKGPQSTLSENAEVAIKVRNFGYMSVIPRQRSSAFHGAQLHSKPSTYKPVTPSETSTRLKWGLWRDRRRMLKESSCGARIFLVFSYHCLWG